MTAPVEHRRRLATALEQAILGDQGLRFDYQPQIDLGSGALRGLEALARWHDPELGDVPPTVFIPLVEELGLLPRLGERALRAACLDLTRWEDADLRVSSVSVNLDPVTLSSPALRRYLEATLGELGIEPGRVVLEATESSPVGLDPRVADALCSLRELGVGLALDDFGTGYSAFTSVVDLPISELKIDRRFIAAAPRSRKARGVIEAIATLGSDLGLTVVAEGVENTAQRDLAARAGCGVAQGYLYAPALAAGQVPGWVAGRLACR